MALSGIQIYKLLPQTNCKECNFPTCLAFAMKLAAKQVELDACPYVDDDSKAKLAESSAPPIRLVELAAGDRTVKAGNEVVLFRHEKRFFNKPGVFLRVRDSEDEAAIAGKVAAAAAYSVEYVGMELRLDGIAVESTNGNASKFAAAVAAARKSAPMPVILVGKDPEVLAAGLGALDGERALLLGANADNWEAMADLAAKSKAALGVEAETLDDLAGLSEKIQAKGVQDLVLHPAAGNLGQALALHTQIRRLALKNFRPLGFPTVVFADGEGDAGLEIARASQAISKYAGFVVVDHHEPDLVYPLLVLRENIYTDPQKPIQVKPALYEINNPKPTDPLLVTTNFSITYFSVANEVEGSGLPAWLLVADAEGMSVLTAWAAGKFDAERIAKSVKEFGCADKVSKKVLVLPGHVAVLSGELEEELPDWEIKVGPREAVDLPAFMKTVLA